ncbi:protein kinase [Micromonospora sp. CPCC 205371]|nr:protein kinase [Micromonospora sp. CPCC 205371]
MLANGDTGEVWQAVDVGTERAVAVKLLYPDLAADPRLVDRFLRARADLTALWHPCIARLLDVVADGEVLALVTDLVPGTDLGRQLTDSGPLPPALASSVGAAMAEALGTAHRMGVVHGDVKPSNVVIPPPGEGPARLTDFAVALLVRAGRRYPEPFERLRYRAPEVTDGAVPTPPSDVYALGVVLTEMLPDDPPHPLSLLADACLQDDPAARPSGAALRVGLGGLGAGLGGGRGRERPHPPPRSRPPRRRHPSGSRLAWLLGSPTRLVAIFAVAMVIVLGAFVVTRFLGSGQAETDQAGSPTTGAPGGAASVPGTAGPSLPTAAGEHSRDGGEAFIRYWFDLLTYAQRSGDTTDLDEATNDRCGDCGTALSTIRDVYAEGGSLRGGAYLVRRIATNSLFTLDRPIYEATVDRSPRATIDRSGVERGSLPGLTVANCILILEWAGDRWQVLDFTSRNCVA